VGLRGWGIGRRRAGASRVARALSGALLLAGLVCASGAQAKQGSPSLPAQEGTATRPGPAVLYQPLAQAPQLENAKGSGWRAQPILISGASAYRRGEFLYQGYVYDDHGAKEALDPTNPMISPGGDASGGDTFSEPNGTYTYPTGPGYDENAANLIELRVRPKGKATAFRITLNTLENPDLVATAIAIGGKEGEVHPFPFGANVSAPAQYFLTVHGETATLTDAASGAEVPGPAPSVSVDLARRQITVEVVHSEWNPTSTVRLAAGVGLWNASTDSYLLPGAVASATQPGGAGPNPAPPAFFDVAFRFNEQEPMPGTPGAQTETSPAYWRESAQAQALASGDISAFHADVDFAKLKAKSEDDMPGQPTGVPQSGAFDRILASHFSDGQGADYATGGCGSSSACVGEMRGQLLPYAIYVPSAAQPSTGWGATLLLHSLSANYNQFAGTKNQSEFAARGPGSIVFTPSGRGPDGWYYDHAGAETFEVWADVAAHYRLNPSFTDIAGYSMGGYGTYKFASQFPDLFARAQPTVGPPGLGVWVPPAEPQPGGDESLTERMLGSVRNVPFLIWNETTDELVPIAGVLEQVKAFDDLGYRYEFDQFQAGEHLTLALNDEYAPAAAFLGTETIDPDPAHVTYVYNPTMDFAADGTAAGHAYWVYDVGLRQSGGAAPLGTVDVRSQAFGTGDPPAQETQHGAGALTGGQIPAIPYTSQSKAWGPAPVQAAADALDLTASNVSHVTIDGARAKVDCKAQLHVTTDGPLTVTLADCHGKGRSVTQSFG